MSNDHEIDEVALNTLWAEGVDLPTAVAGSIKDEDAPQTGTGPLLVGMIAGLIVAVILWLL